LVAVHHHALQAVGRYWAGTVVEVVAAVAPFARLAPAVDGGFA
jgi:hypothetical protein